MRGRGGEEGWRREYRKGGEDKREGRGVKRIGREEKGIKERWKG